MRDSEFTQTLNFIRKDSKQNSNTIKVGHSIEDMSLMDIIQKALRHKYIFISVTLVFVIVTLAAYKAKGNLFTREITAQFNDKENNILFQNIDTIVPDAKSGAKSTANYASRALSALRSDDFVSFVLQRAKDDSQIKSLIKLSNVTDTSANIKDPNFIKTRNFFNSKVVFRSTDVPGAIVLKVMSSGAFLISIKDTDPDWIENATHLVTRLVSDYIAKREIDEINVSRAIVTEKIQNYKKEIQELTDKLIALHQKTPSGTIEVYRSIESAMQGTRVALAGNKALEARYLELVQEIEQKLTKYATDLGDEEDIALLRRELAGLSYQQKLEKIQGVDPESNRTKQLTSTIQDTVNRLNALLKDKSNKGLFYDPTNADVISQEEKLSNDLRSVEEVREENEFYKIKLNTLGEMLKEIKKEIDYKFTLEIEKKEIDRAISAKEKIISNLETSLIRLDLSDFKSLKRIEVFQGNITQKGKFPFGTLIFLATCFGLFAGLILAFLKEQNNPSLRTIHSFEEIGLPILGGVPATDNFLFTQTSQISQEDSNSLQYVRIALNLGNLLNFIQSKIVLFTSSEKTIQSSTICYNTAAYYARIGRKVLIIEADMHNNYICKLTGLAPNGGLNNILNSSTDVNITLASAEKNLDILSGDNSKLPPLYRLSSESFYSLLNELKQNYDYIFIHSRPLLESPEAADLSRYSGASIICTDASQANLRHLERVVVELRLFLSKYSYFILEKTEDRTARYNKSKKHSRKNRDSNNMTGDSNTSLTNDGVTQFKKAS